MLRVSRAANYSANRFRNKSGLVAVNNVGGWHGRSSAASSSREPQTQTRSPKKVSKDERRALLLSYVNKYRAEHNGKFPSVKDAIKNVGGGFYTIRIMIQELQYKSKIASSSDDVNINDATQKHFRDEGAVPSSLAAKDVQSIASPSDQPDLFTTQSDLLTGNGENVSHSCLEKADSEKMEEPRGSHSDFATDTHAFQEEIEENFQNHHENANSKSKKAEELPKFVETESHLLKLSFGNADEKKEQSISEASLNSGGLKQEAQPHKLSPEAEKEAMDVSSKQQPDDAEPPKQSTLWGNLKSFADGFIKMWRKF